MTAQSTSVERRKPLGGAIAGGMVSLGAAITPARAWEKTSKQEAELPG